MVGVAGVAVVDAGVEAEQEQGVAAGAVEAAAHFAAADVEGMNALLPPETDAALAGAVAAPLRFRS